MRCLACLASWTAAPAAVARGSLASSVLMAKLDASPERESISDDFDSLGRC